MLRDDRLERENEASGEQEEDRKGDQCDEGERHGQPGAQHLVESSLIAAVPVNITLPGLGVARRLASCAAPAEDNGSVRVLMLRKVPDDASSRLVTDRGTVRFHLEDSAGRGGSVAAGIRRMGPK